MKAADILHAARHLLCCAYSLSCLRLCDPMDGSLPVSSVHGILQSRILEWVAMPFSRGSSNPGIEPRSPALQADSLPSELSAKPKNTGLGTLSLLQGIFLTQESNQGLLHCRQILYQLICQGSPLIVAIDILNTINLEVTVFIHCGICPSKD